MSENIKVHKQPMDWYSKPEECKAQRTCRISLRANMGTVLPDAVLLLLCIQRTQRT